MELTLKNNSNVNTLFVGNPEDNATREIGGGNLFYGDPASFSPNVFKYVMERFNVKSVLDVGAGLGNVGRYLIDTFKVPVLGIDGLPFNVKNCAYPIVEHNLTKGGFVCSPVDLTVCVEVVEHIEEKYLDSLLDTLTNGRFILMTHALPGTGGEFHYNEQPSEYWIEKLATRGYGLLAADSNIVRRLGASENHGATYFAQSGLVFGRVPGAQTSSPEHQVKAD